MGARNFDPVALADAEFAGWLAYHRRQWLPFLGVALRMVRVRFGMPWRRTLLGAWYVQRANRAWARYPGLDAPRTREYLRRFYELVVRDGDLSIDPAEAADRELESWRVHRLHRRTDEVDEDDLTEAVVQLYAYVYEASPESVREAARQRVVALRHSDAWAADGGRRDDPNLQAERAALAASYTALRAAVGR